MVGQATQTVEELRWLNESTYVLRFTRQNFSFSPGQYVNIGLEHGIDMREYSIYSSPTENYLEILVKEIPQGYLSPRLHALRQGDALKVDGPFGFFLIPDDWREREFFFVATGTGISPFHCFANTYPDMNYQLIHGIRTMKDASNYEVFHPSRLRICTSQSREGEYHGRVTHYLREHPLNKDGVYYLCGNCDMIYEVYDILQEQEIDSTQIFAEVYF